MKAPRLFVAIVVLHVGLLVAQDSVPSPRQNTGRVLSLDALFQLLDKDGDGRISREEATGAYAARFPLWDANGDGFATRAEIHNYRLSIGLADDGNRLAGSATPGPGRRPARGSTAGTVLKEPADWRLENLPVPPGFAPTIRFRGSEEIRFAPGMFKPDASDYFTCVIAITADDAPELGADDLKDFLQKYYRGLSGGRAQRSGTPVDTSQMNAIVKPISGDGARDRYEAQIDFFDTFSDGRKITLNIEARVFPKSAVRKTTLLLLVSPSAKDSPAWATLHQIGDKTVAGMDGP